MAKSRKKGKKTPSKRVSVGTALACTTTLLVYGLWRVAATFDSGAGSEAFGRLVLEAFAFLITVPFYVLFVSVLGALLVHKGTGARSHSIMGSTATALLYTIFLYWTGYFSFEEMEMGSSAPLSMAALLIAGAAGGFIGHAGWYPVEDDAA